MRCTHVGPNVHDFRSGHIDHMMLPGGVWTRPAFLYGAFLLLCMPPALCRTTCATCKYGLRPNKPGMLTPTTSHENDQLCLQQRCQVAKHIYLDIKPTGSWEAQGCLAQGAGTWQEPGNKRRLRQRRTRPHTFFSHLIAVGHTRCLSGTPGCVPTGTALDPGGLSAVN